MHENQNLMKMRSQHSTVTKPISPNPLMRSIFLSSKVHACLTWNEGWGHFGSYFHGVQCFRCLETVCQ